MTRDPEKNRQTTTRDPASKRSFLTYATAGMCLIGGGVSLSALGRTMAPSASVRQTAPFIRLDISSVEPGTQIMVLFKEKPVFIVRLNEAQVREAIATEVSDLPDPLARNANLVPDARATFENRSFLSTHRFVVLNGTCPRLGCVPFFGVGEHKGWRCQCDDAEFDILSRLRNGPTTANMSIPRYEAEAGNVLRLINPASA